MNIFHFLVFIFVLDHLCYIYSAKFNPSNCLLTEHDRKYNLTDVAHIIIDFQSEQSENSNSSLVINLCNNNSPQTKECPEEPNICILKNNKTESLGYRSVKYDLDDNIIIIEYVGDKATTHIKLICSPGKRDSRPRYLSVSNKNCSPHCNTTIEWESKAACPMDYFSNNSCTLYHPQMNVFFDFNILNTLYTVRDNEHNHDYYLLPCKDLNDNSTIHQKLQTGFTLSLGKIYNRKLEYSNGELTLRYFNGTKYKKGLQRESKIYFICDKTAGLGIPKFFKEIPPTYIFEWSTAYACVHEMPNNCAWSNATHRIDVSMLVHNLFGLKNDSIVFNICRPLQMTKKNKLVNCNPPIGICKENINLGSKLLSPPKFNNEKIELTYVDGNECGTGNYSTKVIIECGYYDSLAEVSINDECSYTIKAKSFLLCEPHRVYANHCVFTDEFTGFKVDLNFAFKDVKSVDGVNFTLCQNNMEIMHTNECKDAALCGLKKDGQSLQSYGNIWYPEYKLVDKFLHLSFYNGSNCEETKGKWSTLLKFECDANISSPHIILLSNSSCQMIYGIKLRDVCSLTSFVCALRRGGNFYNLRSLSSLHHSWKVKNNEDEYSINICRSLPDSDDDVTALLTRKGKQYRIGLLRMMKLYFEDSSENSTIILRYDAEPNNLCNSTEDLPISTRIKFICTKHDHLSFQGKGISNGYCMFNFTWQTFYACPFNKPREKIEFVLNKTKLYDPHLNLSFDISPIINTPYVVEHEKVNYIFNISGTISNKKCINAAICQKGQDERDIGSHNTIIFFSQGVYNKALKMQAVSTNDQKCGKNMNKNVTTEITFYCSENRGYGKPQFLYESMDCDYYFEWWTNLTCLNTLHLHDSQITNVQLSIPVEKKPPSFGIFLVLSGVFLIAASALGLYILRRSDLKRRWQKDSIYFTNLIELADPI